MCQIQKFKPKLVSIKDGSLLPELRDALKNMEGKLPEFVAGDDGIVDVAKFSEADVVVTGIVGCAGLKPTCAAIEAGERM